MLFYIIIHLNEKKKRLINGTIIVSLEVFRDNETQCRKSGQSRFKQDVWLPHGSLNFTSIDDLIRIDNKDIVLKSIKKIFGIQNL